MKQKEYSNGEITILWEPGKCIHSGICVKGLPRVFQPSEKPWIKIEAESTSSLINQVNQCPSGALSYFYPAGKGEKESQFSNSEPQFEVRPNGPLMVYGDIEVKFRDGRIEKKQKNTAFCRCGSSQNKPYCDGSHKKINFQG
ncbi:(4Fe-4S)-binding protein [Shivajiella indica]|uniref:(4Fe-4S)-binding protein n=1 Tax=Shivajiella indica TaxID=872115 RepID=A0ABW5BEB3_9BACT